MNTLKSVTAGDASAAVAGVLLAMPFAVLITLLLLHIEPPLGPLDPLLKGPVDQPNVLGSAIVFGAWLLSIVALMFGLAPVARATRRGNGMATKPVNFVVAGVLALLVISLPVGLVVDQYPCWIGVPNCD